MEDLGPCNRYKGEVCTKKRKGISIVKGRERRGVRVYTGATEKRIHPTLKVTSNSTSVLCRKEEQEEVDGAGLQIFKQIDN